MFSEKSINRNLVIHTLLGVSRSLRTAVLSYQRTHLLGSTGKAACPQSHLRLCSDCVHQLSTLWWFLRWLITHAAISIKLLLLLVWRDGRILIGLCPDHYLRSIPRTTCSMKECRKQQNYTLGSIFTLAIACRFRQRICLQTEPRAMKLDPWREFSPCFYSLKLGPSSH